MESNLDSAHRFKTSQFYSNAKKALMDSSKLKMIVDGDSGAFETANGAVPFPDTDAAPQQQSTTTPNEEEEKTTATSSPLSVTVENGEFRQNGVARDWASIDGSFTTRVDRHGFPGIKRHLPLREEVRGSLGRDDDDDEEANKGHRRWGLLGRRGGASRPASTAAGDSQMSWALRTVCRFHRKLWRNDNGGDFPTRFDVALRTTFAVCLFFSVLVGSEQKALESVWLGNVILHATMKGSLGAALSFAWILTRDLAITIGVSWSINLGLRQLGQEVFAVLLPFVTAILTFVIMTAPYLKTRNIMIVIMWVTIQLDLYSEPDAYNGVPEPVRLFATCLAGIATALAFTSVPPKTGMALHRAQGLLARIQRDTDMLLQGTIGIMLNAGSSSSTARLAVSSVELACDRLNESSRALTRCAADAELEARLVCRSAGRKKTLSRWASFVSCQQIHVEVIRAAVTKRLLGEEHSAYSDQIRDAKVFLADNMGDELRDLTEVMSRCMQYLSLEATGWSASNEANKNAIRKDLQDARLAYRNAWFAALPQVETILAGTSDGNAPSSAVLIRRMQLFYGLHKLCSSLGTYMDEDPPEEQPSCSTPPLSWLHGYVVQPWPKPTLRNYRLPLKASVGMAIASLWVVVPFLYERAKPFEYWPGITVASVNLATMGSSYQKCVDRLWGTLLAAAYALLLNFFFVSGESFSNNAVKIAGLTVWTFVCIYLRNPSRPYPTTYAAMSIGSILYGSIQNEFNVEGYVVLRIVLIFTGILIFVVTESLIFPRSSRKSVQNKSKQFLEEVLSFMKQAQGTVATLCASFAAESLEGKTDGKEGVTNGATVVVSDAGSETYADGLTKATPLEASFDALEECFGRADTQISKARRDLESAIAEPSLGFDLRLDQNLWTEFTKAEEECKDNMKLLVEALKTLKQLYMDEDYENESVRLREWRWPELYGDMIRQVALQLEASCSDLDVAFPSGRIRPQNENQIEAVIAASSFRNFEDVRLIVLAVWSKRYSSFLSRHKGPNDANDTLKGMITLGYTASLLLEIAYRLQKSGAFLEAITRTFPARSGDITAEEQSTMLQRAVAREGKEEVKRQSLFISNYA